MFTYSNTISNIWVPFNGKIIDILQIESIEGSASKRTSIGLKSGRTIEVELAQKEVWDIIVKNTSKES